MLIALMIILIVTSIVIVLVVLVVYSCLVVAAKSEMELIQIEEFQGYKYCDEDCYMCDYQIRCQRTAMKEYE